MRPEPWTATEYNERLLVPVGAVTLDMERHGVPVDCVALREIEADMAAAGTRLRGELNQWTAGRDFNWNSWQQLASWLHDAEADGGLGLEPSPYWKKGEVARAEGEIKTDDRALEWLAGHNEAHRAPIQTLRKLRQCERMARYARDWLDKCLPHADGSWRLHPSFGLASDHDTRPGAVTGRFGVKNPPLNQVPRDPKKDPAGIRRAFVAPPGRRLVVVDFSQLEVVILGHLCALLFDGKLAERLRGSDDLHSLTGRYTWGELGGDAEALTAPLPAWKQDSRLKGLRDLTKAVRYGLNYGKGVKGFATSVFLPSGEPLGAKRAQLLVDGLFGFDPEVPAYQRFIREFIEREALIVSLFGRWQPLPHAHSSKMGWRNRAWRQALNYPMQAGGQEIMALALIAVSRDSYLQSIGFELALVVHDEIVGWAPEDLAEDARKRVEQLMCECVELLAPLKAEGHTGATWKDCK